MNNPTRRPRDPGRGKFERIKNKNGQVVWRADYVDADGKRRRRILSSDKRVVEKRLAALIKERDDALAGTAPNRNALIEEIQVDYLEAMRLVWSRSQLEELRRLLPMVMERFELSMSRTSLGSVSMNTVQSVTMNGEPTRQSTLN